MSDSDSPLERYAKIMGTAEINKELLSQTRILPCSYGSGNCIYSYWARDPYGSNVPVMAAMCLKARQVRRGLFSGSIERRLKESGCLEPRHFFLTGWECNYADGSANPL